MNFLSKFVIINSSIYKNFLSFFFYQNLDWQNYHISTIPI